MLLDGLFLVVAIGLAVNGWHRGLIASWRGLLAMILATVAVKFVYVDFSAWLLMRLQGSLLTAVVFGYLICWLTAEILIEMGLGMIFKEESKRKPRFADRAGGVLYGLSKASVIFLLPAMAIAVEIQIPPPPAVKTAVSLPELRYDGYLIAGFRQVARALVPVIGPYVVSERPPGFEMKYKQPDKGRDSQEATGEILKENGGERRKLEELLE